MNITVKNGTISPEEQQAYKDYIRKKHPDKIITGLVITLDGDDVLLSYHYEPVPFERIRRITGYLVGAMNRWNNGKRAEEADRVKHGV